MAKAIIVQTGNQWVQANREVLSRLDDLLNQVQIKSKVRVLSAEDIIKHLSRVEHHLGIPKKDMVGVEVDADPHAQSFPNAYRGIPESTHFTATYTARGWKITGVRRSRTRSVSKGTSIKMPSAAEMAVVRSRRVM